MVAMNPSQNLSRPALGSGYEMPEPGIVVKFFKQAQFLEHATKLAMKQNPNATPIFEDVDMVEINFTADKYSQIVQRADKYRHRWPETFKRYQEGKGMDGLALENWDKLSPSQVAQFNAMHIYTVEQLATIPETGAGAAEHKFIGMAKAYVNSQDAANQNRELNAKLALVEEASKEREAALQKQLESLTKALDALTQAQNGKPAKKVAAKAAEPEEEEPAEAPQMAAPKMLPPHMQVG